MTPSARLNAAIEILDIIQSGESAERVLTTWARGNRYAGSKDRAAIRGHVFDVLRCLRSFGWLGGAGDAPATGRQLVLGLLRANGEDPAETFTGTGYAPTELSEDEEKPTSMDGAPDAVRLDCPDWLYPLYPQGLGNNTDAVLERMRARAPLFLRVNTRKATLETALEALQKDNIEAKPHALCDTALEVTLGARAVVRSQAYLTGLVEIQDVASQALLNHVPLQDGMKVLDYCAGGGGKSLAMAALADVDLTAHDVDLARMQDIVPRASRAGVDIKCLIEDDLEQNYDFIFCDVPCSGSGAWARAPQAKWDLTPERFEELQQIQSSILSAVAYRVAPGGYLIYATCSLFVAENGVQVTRFLSNNPEFSQLSEQLISPLEGGDGFYVAILKRD